MGQKGRGARMDRGGRLGSVLRRALPAVLTLALAAFVLRLGAGQQPGPVVEPVYGHDMLDVVAPWWMAVLSKALMHPVMWAAVLVGAVSLVVVALRDGPRAAAPAGFVWFGANLTVQAVKHGLVPLVPGDAAPQLSGHTAVVAGAALLLVAAAPARWRRVTALACSAVLVGVGVGVVLVGWHTPAQATVPVLVTCAWAALLRPWVAAAGRRAEPVHVDETGVPSASPAPDGR